MPPVETDYYDMLDVPVDVEGFQVIGKAWYDATVKCEEELDPPDAMEMSQELYKAFKVLTDPRLRALYDKYGKSGVSHVELSFEGDDSYGEDDVSEEDGASEEDDTSEEDGASEEDDASEEDSASEEDCSSEEDSASEGDDSSEEGVVTDKDASEWLAELVGGGRFVAYTGGVSLFIGTEEEREECGRRSPTSAQRGRMWEERVETLSKQLVERLQPFVEARNPGVNNDSGTSAFRARMRKEAEELRMENLGPQLLHTIGSVYEKKATSSLKKGFSFMPQFLSFAQESGILMKDITSLVFSGSDTLSSLFSNGGQDPGEELRWKGYFMAIQGGWMFLRFGYKKLLREVCDRVLKDPTVSETVRVNRAKGLLEIAATFKTEPDEPDLELSEVKRMLTQTVSTRWDVDVPA